MAEIDDLVNEARSDSSKDQSIDDLVKESRPDSGGKVSAALNYLKKFIPEPSSGMYKQYEDFLNQEEKAGVDPSRHPAAMAIGGMLNNVAEGLKNPEAVANTIQDVTTFGKGQHLPIIGSANVNAWMAKKFFGAGDDALQKENERQDKLRADNPYLPFIVGPLVNKFQSLIPTEGVVPEWLTKKPGEFLENKGADIAGARSAGLTKTQRQIKGPEGLRKLGKTMLDEGVIGRPGTNSTEEMIHRAEALREKGGAGMDEVYNKIDSAGLSKFNPEDVANQLESKHGAFYRDPANEDILNQYEKIKESIQSKGAEGRELVPGSTSESWDITGPKSQPIDVQSAQLLKQKLGKLSDFKNKIVIGDKAKIARKAYGIVKDAIDAEASRAAPVLGEDVLGGLRRAKNQYGVGKTLVGPEWEPSGSLQSLQASQQGKPSVGMLDYISGLTGSVIGGAGAHSPGAAIAGAAAGVAGKKLLTELGNPNTQAFVATKVGDLLQKAPQFFGKFAPALKAASQIGGPLAVAVENYKKQSTDPQYRQIINHLTDEGNR